ncbi:riboflavin synthase [Romboutsia lituseburensis]|uniref:Riboflavin synthase n=1 Tax=Romboutsia lituseburensis DSM 797 TaxID=1121325 RepID=A0A1G9HZG1_9FIRM|nr:riboflavin synthase [Romboutsia lituseburensis]CEH34124.1 Riboflavin synthase [Romboutsia lituseburensis]SDL18054.1 riboflavin synthase alpha chain [Romboutsia lituseburensis DSM 797]
MFTGIIEEIGIVKEIKKSVKSSKIKIEADKILENINLGDSISTNGVCLTASSIAENHFEADVMAETLRRSNLGKLKTGSKVNLERALCIEKRLGGHIVSGHIDGTGEIISFIKEDNAIWVSIKTSKELLKYIVEKGSIAIDGISLTVAYVDDYTFKVSIIPHTKNETTLLNKNIKDTVNIECDMIGKYVEKLLGLNKKSIKNNLNEDFLKNNGFI